MDNAAKGRRAGIGEAMKLRGITDADDLAEGDYIAFSYLPHVRDSRHVPVRVESIVPAKNAAGRPGKVVYCEDWQGRLLRYTFSEVKQNGGIVDDLDQWFREHVARDAETYKKLLAAREEVSKTELERLRRLTLKDIEPEWVRFVQKALEKQS